MKNKRNLTPPNKIKDSFDKTLTKVEICVQLWREKSLIALSQSDNLWHLYADEQKFEMTKLSSTLCVVILIFLDEKTMLSFIDNFHEKDKIANSNEIDKAVFKICNLFKLELIFIVKWYTLQRLEFI